MTMETRTSALLGVCGLAFIVGPPATLPEVPPSSAGVFLGEPARGQATELRASVAVGMHVPTPVNVFVHCNGTRVVLIHISMGHSSDHI
jgi:hypothetical protein